ncbi:hypothetical protein [Nocardia wallacei]|uniref:hypothetical protein n=1 Tax=Nocardia wallacei TaxID=480035 RepID=UPI0024550209|nr:hypothetical protein [Nocardia wallacei]
MTGTEKPRITDGGEHTDEWDHWRIYNAFNPLNTTEANKSVDEYAQIARRWTSAAELFANRIRHSSEAAWEGPAAEKSRTAIGNYAQRALDLTVPLQNLAQQVSSAIDGVNNTRNAVDRPPDGGAAYNPRSWNLGVWHGPSSAHVRNDCENTAREAMKNNYVANFVEADKQIPVLPVPDSPTNPLYKPPETKKDDSYVPGGLDIPDPGGTTPDPGTGKPNGEVGTADQSGETTQDPSTAAAGSDPSQTAPASALGEQAGTTPSSIGAPTTASGYSGGHGGGGLGSGGGLGGVAGGPGRSVAGGQSAAGGAAAAAGRVGAAGAGMPGMPGMGGLGGGRGKPEDDEKAHELPEWLRNMENAEELLGPAPKTIPGGVIGGDYADPPPPSG